MTELDAVIAHVQSLFEAYSPTITDWSEFHDYQAGRSIFKFVVRFPFTDDAFIHHIHDLARGLSHVDVQYILRGDGMSLVHMRISFPGREVERVARDDPDSERYHDNMPGMTLDEFQAWSDQVIRETRE